MLLVLSPSKTLDYETPHRIKKPTMPEFLDRSQLLIAALRKKTPHDLIDMMEISEKLALLNAQRYKDFHLPFTLENARPALLAFKGDVYEGMQVADYSATDFAFAQKHLRILSGLYGLLRPLDLMQPYRLEMGTGLKVQKHKNLYEFWGDDITKSINKAIVDSGGGPLVNLASEEYFKAVRPVKLDSELLNIAFKERRDGKVKTIALFAKRARGLMADYAIRHRLTQPAQLKKFEMEGYRFDSELSEKNVYCFVRG